MITMCCTQKLLRRLRIAKPDAIAHLPTNALGNWYVNLIYIGRAQVVLATSERSLLTVLLPAADLRNSLVVNLGDTTCLLLQEIGIDSACAAREAEAMHPALIARTKSRSVLASMNDFSLSLDWYWHDGLAPMEIMLRFAATPKSALISEGGITGNPAEITRALLGAAGKGGENLNQETIAAVGTEVTGKHARIVTTQSAEMDSPPGTP
jgi:hypothetical protein